MLSALLVAAALPATAAADRSVLVMDGGTVRTEAAAPTPALPPAPRGFRPVVRLPASAAASRRTVTSELHRLEVRGDITRAQERSRKATWDRANVTYRRLSGQRRRELGAVIVNLKLLTARGGLRASRLPALFLQLERNREWWSKGPLLRYGQRVRFAGSQILYEAFPGQGLVLHVLGNFGQANGLRQAGSLKKLRALLAELRPLAAWRAGGRTWEYYFQFGSRSIAWASGIAQGTAVQAFSKAGVRLKDPSMLALARSGLKVFQKPPPTGLRIRFGGGRAHYLIYSYAPHQRVLNAFAQALNGLWDTAKYAKSATARALYEAGRREIVRELPRYDTGAWSLYDGHYESSLSYHVLLRDFLRGLCDRGAGRALCAKADRFTLYLEQPPRVTLTSTDLVAGKPALVRFRLSKESRVGMTIRRGGRIVRSTSAVVPRGRHGYPWTVPKATGDYDVTLTARDLAGNASRRTQTVTVTRKRA
jgi:hypothetical protein